METRNYWEDNGHVKYDNYNSNDGFGRPGEANSFVAAPPSEDEGDFPVNYLKKGKVSRQDPMSHRIIEKRRRDRMNNCLADLSRLIPPEYLKKGRGRVEKTEIIEMAIRHLKYLQDRANAERQVWGEHFKAGYQEATSEAMRYLADQGYPSSDPLTMSLAAHLQRHCDHVIKGEPHNVPKESRMHKTHPGSSSETTSSSSSSQGYTVKPGVIAQAPPIYASEPYEPERTQEAYSMDCERVAVTPSEGEVHPLEIEPLPLDGRRKREPTLRAIRKPDHEDYLHSYKFKNSIERRFSRSQDSEAAELLSRTVHAHKSYGHKRRRAPKMAPSISTSNSGSTEDTRDTSPQDTSSDSPHQHYDTPSAAQYVPVFALNAHGKYYVPLSVDYACLLRHLGPYDVLDARAVQLSAPLHPVTIHVNFQSCLNYHVKREPAERDWRPV